MRKISYIFFSLTLFLLGLFLLNPNIASAKSYQFESWQAEATINQDSTIDFREVIEIDFDGSFSKFWRSIEYRGLDSIKDISVREIIDSGNVPVDYEVSRDLSEMKITINDQINSEVKKYQLNYTVHGVVTYQESWDELYWNVTPSQIDVPINSASLVVNLPSEVDSQAWRHQIYSQADNTNFEVAGDSSVRFSSSELGPGEDFTIVLGWPKEIVDYRLNRTKLFQIIALILPILSIVGLIVYHYRKKKALGFNRSIAPEFAPPKEREPILVEGLTNEMIGSTGLTSSLINIARKGYIKIIQKEKQGIFSRGKEYIFKKTKSSFEGLTKLERRLADDMFDGKDEVKGDDLKNSFYKDYKKIVDSATDKMISLKWFHHKPSNLRGIYIALTAFLLPGIIFLATFLETILIRGVGYLVGSLGLSLIIWLIYGAANTKKTAEGVSSWQKWQGFKMFLGKTERFKMSEIEDKGKSSQVGEGVFEEYLPYAIALGVADAWANRFKDFKLNQPDWLEGDIGSYNAAVMASSISGLNTSAGSTMLSSPSGGSGYGGGSGFSGGGAGGGGGGGGAGAS